MYLEEQKQLSSEIRHTTLNLQAKGEVLAAASADQGSMEPLNGESETKDATQQVAPEETQAGKEEKPAEEQKSTEEAKSQGEGSEGESENAQNSRDVSILAVTGEGETNPANLREGHSETLTYVSYGLPTDVDSVASEFIFQQPFYVPPPLYLPPILPFAEPFLTPTVVEEAVPCCVLDVPIIDVLGLSSIFPPEAINFDNNDLFVSGRTYSFTFEGFCDDNTPPNLVFTDTFSGNSTTLEIPINFCDGLDEFFVPSCDNPIASIELYRDSSSIFFINGIELFRNSLVWDTNGNLYLFMYETDENGDPTDQLILQSNACSSAPIVLDLNNNGFELIDVRDSNVLLSVEGKSVKTGWVEATDGFLTYGYSGQGAIENKNFILTDNVPGAKTDLEALRSLAGQESGIIDNSSVIWEKLGVWQDMNQNGKMDTNEYHTLSELGIKSIGLEGTQEGIRVQSGNVIHETMTFTYMDGTIGKAADVALRYEDVIQSNTNVSHLDSAESSTPSTPSGNTEASAGPVVQDAAVHSAVEAVVQQQPTQQV